MFPKKICRSENKLNDMWILILSNAKSTFYHCCVLVFSSGETSLHVFFSLNKFSVAKRYQIESQVKKKFLTIKKRKMVKSTFLLVVIVLSCAVAHCYRYGYNRGKN